MKDLGLNLRPIGREFEPSAVFDLEAGFGEFRGKADFNRCTERLAGGEPATRLGADADTSRDAELSGRVSGASVFSAFSEVSCKSL